MQLAAAVPQVVGHRVARMALAGPQPSARDRREFERMVAEKQQAFLESWREMVIEAARLNWGLAQSWLSPAAWARPAEQPTKMARHAGHAAVSVLNKGLAPVHRAAVANARRLAKTKLR